MTEPEDIRPKSRWRSAYGTRDRVVLVDGDTVRYVKMESGHRFRLNRREFLACHRLVG